MKIFKKRFQPPSYKVQGRWVRLVNSKKQSIVLSNLHEYDLTNSVLLLHYGLRRSSSYHSIFVRHFLTGAIILIVYIHDIVVTGDDHHDIIQLKAYLSSHFHIKDLSLLKYFLEIEVTRSPKGLSLS